MHHGLVFCKQEVESANKGIGNPEWRGFFKILLPFLTT